jgi:energy-coupling factor transporter ATP-binding protein EcfA2
MSDEEANQGQAIPATAPASAGSSAAPPTPLNPPPESPPAAEPAFTPSAPAGFGTSAAATFPPGPPLDQPPIEAIARVPMSRLTGIEIKNYFAYRGTFRLDLPGGENLLVYGENGAGKSSLFHTLRVFMEAPDIRVPFTMENGWKTTRSLALTDNQHRFTKEPPSVKLEFGQRHFEWTATKNETSDGIVRSLNKGKGFLDYRALLEVHYVRSVEKQGKAPELNLFPLLIQSLLPYYTYAHQGTSRTFKERWAELQSEMGRRWQPSRRQREPEKDFLGELEAFNEAFEKAINDLGTGASAMLKEFDDAFQIEFRFSKARFKYGPKRIEGPEVLAVPAFRKLHCPDYHNFLNEARLSALAICLFLAALEKSPATGLRVLVLDDILIGLDMVNRVKVIDLIYELVSDNPRDWQVIIMTYSKAWFERLKDHLHTPKWMPPWKSVVLWEEWRNEDNSPHTIAKENSPHIVAEGSGTLIEMADRHLQHKDYKAAAVYARSALEAICHHTCAKASLAVVHVTSPKDRKVEHYIDVLVKKLGQLKEDTARHTATKLIARLREAQSFVLNRNSHFDVEDEDTLSGEVKAAIQTVKDLADLFEKLSWKKGDFNQTVALSAADWMAVELAEARKLARFGPKEDAVKKLAASHNHAWEAFGIREKVSLPIGTSLNAKAIWTAALGEKKLNEAFDARLKAARPYLFGCVKSEDFDPTKFEEAAKLIEELSA